MIRTSIILSLLFMFAFCTPKGPQTFKNRLVGKTKQDLIRERGTAHRIKIFDNSEAYIYIKKEEYYGKKSSDPFKGKPKKVYEIEYIYYINQEDIIYKYQVWKKKVKH